MNFTSEKDGTSISAQGKFHRFKTFELNSKHYKSSYMKTERSRHSNQKE
jgi:hypothetical protein